MRVEPRDNLYVLLLRQHLYGSDRLMALPPAAAEAINVPHVSFDQQIRKPDAGEEPGQLRLVDTSPWQHDSAIGIDPPCTSTTAASQLGEASDGSDNSEIPPPESPGLSVHGFPTDSGLGTLLDVFA